MKHERARGAAPYVNDLDAHPYLRTFPRCAFHIDVVPEVAKGGARDLCCRNRGADRGTRRDEVDRSNTAARPTPFAPTEHATYLAGISRRYQREYYGAIPKCACPKRMPRSPSSNAMLGCGMPSLSKVLFSNQSPCIVFILISIKLLKEQRDNVTIMRRSALKTRLTSRLMQVAQNGDRSKYFLDIVNSRC